MTEKALEQAQQLLHTLLSPGFRETDAMQDMVVALDKFLAAYGVDGETDLSTFKRRVARRSQIQLEA